MIRKLRLVNVELLTLGAQYASLRKVARRGFWLRVSVHLVDLARAAEVTRYGAEYSWIAEAYSQWETFSYAVQGHGSSGSLPPPREDLIDYPSNESNKLAVQDCLLAHLNIHMQGDEEISELLDDLVSAGLPSCIALGRILEALADLHARGVLAVPPQTLIQVFLDALEKHSVAWILIQTGYLEEEIVVPTEQTALAFWYLGDFGSDTYTFAVDEIPKSWALISDATDSEPLLMERLQSDAQLLRFRNGGGYEFARSNF